MKIITDLREFQNKTSKPIVLALGNFDGFHRGHQKLLRYVKAQARKHQALAAALTFRQHPHHILYPKQKPLLLSSLEQKLFYLAQAGMDLCFFQSFTPAFSRLSAREFVEKILVRKLHVREVCMGYDAHFGYRREGDARKMRLLAKEHGFLFRSMEPVLIGKTPVSSSLVRKLLLQGKMEKVRECLGRPFSLFGKVVHGKGHGIHLGFPTANLEIHSDVLIPLGVYAASGRFLNCGPRKRGQADFSKKNRRYFLRTESVPKKSACPPWLPGVVNFGKRPTYPAFETPKPVLELHLLNYGGELYGETMEVALHQFLRPEKKFAAEDSLIRQIGQDVRDAQNYHRIKQKVPGFLK